MSTGTAIEPGASSARDWRAVYILGGVVAFMGIAALLLDIVMTMLPGWGPSTVPSGAASWFAQFASNPWLGVRNLDLLNVMVSVLTLPMFVALFAAHRRNAPGLAGLGLLLVALGTALFVAANAALPMLGLSRAYLAATDPAVRASLLGAAEGLLARGAHGSGGAYPGFLVSELGTVFIAVAMVRGQVFGRVAGWLGLVGAVILLAYTTAYTFVSGTSAIIMAVALPGGLLMIAWQVLVGLGLLRLAREES